MLRPAALTRRPWCMFVLGAVLVVRCAGGMAADVPNLDVARNIRAVVVSTSQYWFNYRHTANALTIYDRLRRTGVHDDHIVLMLADDSACDPRNAERGLMHINLDHKREVYLGARVDYSGADVSAENLLRVLSNRHPPGTPANQRLHSDGDSNVLVFITGHGGDGFMKFRDFEEMTSQDLGLALQQMHASERYNRMLLVADTCEAATLGEHITAPNVFFVGSSARGESSYSHHADMGKDVLVIDRFTHFLTERIDTAHQQWRHHDLSTMTLAQLFNSFTYGELNAHLTTTSTMEGVHAPLVSAFFGGWQKRGLLGATKALLGGGMLPFMPTTHAFPDD